MASVRLRHLDAAAPRAKADSHGVGSSRHSNTPGGRAATDRVSAPRSASCTTTFPPCTGPATACTGAGPGAAVPLQQRLDAGERAADRVQGRRLAGRRRTDQRLPQDQRLRPRRRHAGLHARPAQARDRAQHGLRHVIDRRAGAARGIAHPLAPRLGHDMRGKAGTTGRPDPPAGSDRAQATRPVLWQKSVWPSRGPALRRSRFAARCRFDGAWCRSSQFEFRHIQDTTLLRNVKHSMCMVPAKRLAR